MAPVINKKDMVEEGEAVEEKEDHVVQGDHLQLHFFISF